jgi:hypothetical protein
LNQRKNKWNHLFQGEREKSIHTFLSDKGQRPGEDVHEIG